MTQAIVQAGPQAIDRADGEASSALSIAALVDQVRLIQEAMRAVMKPDTHYGVIPGTPKPTLLKPGAEKLCLLFRLDPQYTTTKTRDGEHIEIESLCTLYHIQSGQRMGSGMGSCSTRESKYAWRKTERTCPKCGAESIIKGKEEYGGGWLCWQKKGGCGAKFKGGDAAIEEQKAGRVPNPDIADQYNTVLKMANKRSLVAAVLNVTAASDLFTQDLEDLPEFAPRRAPSEPEEQSSPRNAAPKPNGVNVTGLVTAIAEAATQDDLILSKDEARSVWKKLNKNQRDAITAAIADADHRLFTTAQREPGSDDQ